MLLTVLEQFVYDPFLIIFLYAFLVNGLDLFAVKAKFENMIDFKVLLSDGLEVDDEAFQQLTSNETLYVVKECEELEITPTASTSNINGNIIIK